MVGQFDREIESAPPPLVESHYILYIPVLLLGERWTGPDDEGLAPRIFKENYKKKFHIFIIKKNHFPINRLNNNNFCKAILDNFPINCLI